MQPILRISSRFLPLLPLALALYFVHSYIGVALSGMSGLFDGRPLRLTALLASAVLISLATAAVFAYPIVATSRRHALHVALAVSLPTAAFRVWSISGTSGKPFLVATLLLEAVALASLVPLLAWRFAKRATGDLLPARPERGPTDATASAEWVARNRYAPPASRVEDIGAGLHSAAVPRPLRLVFALLVVLHLIATVMHAGDFMAHSEALNPVGLLGTLTGGICLYGATVRLAWGQARGPVTFALAAILLGSTLPAWDLDHPAGWILALGAALAGLGCLFVAAWPGEGVRRATSPATPPPASGDPRDRTPPSPP